MHITSPFLSLSTSFRSRSSKSTSDTSTASSTTTSPPSSPTSTYSPQSSPHHLFNLSFHPYKAHTFQGQSDSARHTSNPENPSSRPRPVSDTPHNASVSVLPCAVLRGRSAMVVRRRPSKIDMALSEERSRCDGDAIERQGLGLMEPRPVDLGIGEVKPNFVMGGIFEVMEGRA
ncbi:unnamed protein product [Penicillium nalgiovense]|uniref:Uncharacterized protein n=1 Tax=Penicillium nalgiovense TaxID=60175 RepID=A0A1V6Z4U1_PENNA|nr:hypothetical protein PENNAL_c0003G03945 [Penicillium nalgiovense]CAG7939289.1 unnamed protein product [Penicillium nalgiovense]CAG7941379.1 unnamed protein product [Penicillium nalgiovense]CAG7943101.1 unnamed protein product [Penicillium nalgiovense]CAG7957293.1 unnamed protein product [Penicillium nalgiovense]